MLGISIVLIVLISFSRQQIEIDLVQGSFYNKQHNQMEDNNKKDNEKDNNDELLLTQVKIGNPSQSFHLLVDTTSFLLWIQDSDSISRIPEHQKTFNKHTSSTYQETNKSFTFTHSSNTCSGEFIIDSIDIGSESIPQMTIPLVKEYSSSLLNYDGILGISHSLPNKDNNGITSMHSLIPLLKGLNYTERNVFSIQAFNYSSPKMYIGKEHNDFVLKSNNKSNESNVVSCNTTINPKGYWTCLTNMIIHNNTGIPINFDIVIDSTVEHIYFPMELLPVFKKIIISKENCNAKDNEDKDGIYFDCHSIIDWVSFALVLGNTDSVLKFPNEMLLLKYNDSDLYQVKIFFSDKYDDIHIGTSLFKYYHVLFNAEDKSMSFYSNNKENVGYLKDYTALVIYKTSLTHLIILIVANASIVTLYIIFKVIRYQIRKNKINRYPKELFEEYRYTRMKNSPSIIPHNI